MHDLPLFPDPALGWRGWRLEHRPEGLALVSLTRNDAWPTHEAMAGRCGEASHDVVPALWCTCGLYASSELGAVMHAGIGAYNAAVVGSVAMWGRVIEHEAGMRSQRAYPARLRLVCALCLIDGRGGIDPVLVYERAGAMVTTCATHAPRDVAGMLDPRAVQSQLLSTYGVDVLPFERVEDALSSNAPGSPTRVRRGLGALVACVLPSRARRAA